MRRFLLLLTVLILSLTSVASAAAPVQDGSLDMTFGDGGIVFTDVGASDDMALDIHLQPDGKILVLGWIADPVNGDREFGLARYLPDGSLDTDFGTDGTVITDVGGRDDEPNQMLLRPDGKIVLIGNRSNCVFIRYLPDGSLDNTFGINGVVAAREYCGPAVLLPDNKILMAGHYNGNYVLRLTRYHENGNVDTSFGTNGEITHSAFQIQTNHALLLPDGKLLVVGSGLIDPQDGILIFRLNSDGSLDTTFDSDGMVVLDPVGSWEAGGMALLQPDGKYVIGGAFGNSGLSPQTNLLLARYYPDGSLDTTFDGDGATSAPIGALDYRTRIALQSDGKIIAVGARNEGLSVFRFTATGQPDPAFHEDGVIVIPVYTLQYADYADEDFGTGVAIQSDGRIVVSGFGYDQTLGNSQLTLTRFWGNAASPANPPDAPTGLQAEAVGTKQIDLTWSDSSSDETGFVIERSFDLVSWKPLYASANAQAFSDTTTVCNRTQYYRVRAYRLGDSAYSGYSDTVTVHSKVCPPADFTGDGISEIMIYRNGAWFISDYADESQITSIWTGTGFSSAPVPLTFDLNRGGEDLLSLYTDGAWRVFNSSSQIGGYREVYSIWTGGVAGDIPVPGDYDGDGDDEAVIFSHGAWLFFHISRTPSLHLSVWTGTGTGSTPRPAPMDYDGDGTKDFTVYNSGAWHFFNDNGTYLKGIWVGFLNGIPVPGDYDGDGTEDVVLFQDGAWHWYDFTTGAYDPARSVYTGIPPHKHGGTSTPAPLDIDGDGRMDRGMYAGGPWHFYGYDGALIKTIATGGVVGDVPVSGRVIYP